MEGIEDVHQFIPNAEPEGQCVVIMFAVCPLVNAVCSCRYLIAVVLGGT